MRLTWTLALAAYGTTVWPVGAVHAQVGATPRSAIVRDIEGYAVATCLAAQKNAYIVDQADGWASMIVQRGRGDVAIFRSVANAVRAEVARGDMATIIVESPPMTSKPLPIAFCSEIIDRSRVRTAIASAIRRLAPAYRR